MLYVPPPATWKEIAVSLLLSNSRLWSWGRAVKQKYDIRIHEWTVVHRKGGGDVEGSANRCERLHQRKLFEMIQFFIFINILEKFFTHTIKNW